MRTQKFSSKVWTLKSLCWNADGSLPHIWFRVISSHVNAFIITITVTTSSSLLHLYTFCFSVCWLELRKMTLSELYEAVGIEDLKPATWRKPGLNVGFQVVLSLPSFTLLFLLSFHFPHHKIFGAFWGKILTYYLPATAGQMVTCGREQC